jgi:L-aminopeptidase/D-esterase-like protein
LQSNARRFKRLAILIGIGVIGVLGCGGGLFWLIDTLLGVDHLSEEQIRNGRACTAAVVSVQDTGSVINENTVYEFKLRVQPSDGAGYEATVRDSLNSIEAGRVGAGAGATEFRCVIDRDDASRVEVFWSP